MSARGINAERSLYRQYEELLLKLDKSNELISDMNETIKSQNKTITTQSELIQKLLTEIERLKNKNDKNSINSSKPGSTDNDKPKKSGANLYNSRVKTKKKVGGQKGHKGKSLSKKDVEKLISEKRVTVKEVHHTIKGNPKKEPLIKYQIGIQINTYVEKHIFHFDKNAEEKLPKEFYTDVTYHNYLKSICIELGAYNVVAMDRLSDFLNVISNGIIKVSNGSICNFYKEFSKLSENTIDQLEETLLESSLIYTDETGTKVGSRKGYIRNYSTEKLAIYKAHYKKGHKPIEEDNILTRFIGGIMGDHDTTLYSYGTKNYECNPHVIRYLKEIDQNISYISWPLELENFLYRLNNSVHIAQLYGLEKFDHKKIEEYRREYDEILQRAKEENKTIKSTFYKDKAKKLLNRLIKYKDNHLAFIKDFKVPFSNNLSEQDLRIVKTKTKVSSFRSFAGVSYYANALSIIKTAKKRNINPFSAIMHIFDKKPCF